MSIALVGAALIQLAVIDPVESRYTACLERISVDTDTAYEDALAWRYQGGGWPAEHCVSLALIALGEAEAGSARLRAAAEGAISASDSSRAIMFGQAGDGFLQAGRYGDARAAFERGLTFAEGDAGLSRGVAEASLKLSDFERAETAASAAIETAAQASGQAEALRLRGEARLARGAYIEALEDVQAARALAPEDIDILLLRGRINEAIRTSN